jgi:hypothetical protein
VLESDQVVVNADGVDHDACDYSPEENAGNIHQFDLCFIKVPYI